MTKLSATTIRVIGSVHKQCKEETMMKMCDHLFESKDDAENAINILIEDSKFYRPVSTAFLGELFLALAFDLNKIQVKKPKR